jgi:hypothetical protein
MINNKMIAPIQIKSFDRLLFALFIKCWFLYIGMNWAESNDTASGLQAIRPAKAKTSQVG